MKLTSIFIAVVLVVAIGCSGKEPESPQPAPPKAPDILKSQTDTLNQAKQIDKDAISSAEEQKETIKNNEQ
jgi:hypothetical protein